MNDITLSLSATLEPIAYSSLSEHFVLLQTAYVGITIVKSGVVECYLKHWMYDYHVVKHAFDISRQMIELSE